MVEGMNIKSDFDSFQNTDYWEKYMLNAFQFSAAKTLTQVKMLQSQVFDENGKKRTFYDFKKLAEPINEKFEQWARVEYDLAGRGAVMAGRWQEMYKDRDLYPYWRYETRHDNRVRPEHADLDGKVFRLDDPYSQGLYPPNGWNCRCTAEATDEGRLATKDEIDQLKKDNVSEGFDSNVGIDGIFPKTSTYFELLNNANDAKPYMFDI